MPILLRVAGIDLVLGGPPVAAQISSLSSSASASTLAPYTSQNLLSRAPSPSSADKCPDTPSGYFVNTRVRRIGQGHSAWSFSSRALETADALHLSWARFWRVGRGDTWSNGDVVVVGARVLPFVWVANVNRVVGVESRRDRVSVAWGTTARHVLKGEERIAVTKRRNGDVTFSLHSFSKPAAPIAWIAYPVILLLQKRFAYDVCRRLQDIAENSSRSKK